MITVNSIGAVLAIVGLVAFIGIAAWVVFKTKRTTKIPITTKGLSEAFGQMAMQSQRELDEERRTNIAFQKKLYDVRETLLHMEKESDSKTSVANHLYLQNALQELVLDKEFWKV